MCTGNNVHVIVVMEMVSVLMDIMERIVLLQIKITTLVTTLVTTLATTLKSKQCR